MHHPRWGLRRRQQIQPQVLLLLLTMVYLDGLDHPGHEFVYGEWEEREHREGTKLLGAVVGQVDPRVGADGTIRLSYCKDGVRIPVD